MDALTFANLAMREGGKVFINEGFDPLARGAAAEPSPLLLGSEAT